MSASDDLSKSSAPRQSWAWLRPFIPKRLQPYLRGFRKRLEVSKAKGLAEPFRSIYAFTQVHPIRQQNLMRLCEIIDREKIPGACIECGVLDGGTAALVAYATRNSNRAIHLFDAWEGLPETTEQDGPDAKRWTGEVVGSPRRVASIMSKLRIDPARIKIHKGWFNDTFPTADIPQIALIHADADFYEPTRLILERWYPILSPGGFIQFDDYQSFQGCKQAVDEFLKNHPAVNLEQSGDLGAKAYYLRKPK